MARAASGILLFDRVLGIPAEVEGDGLLAAASFDVSFAGPVTGFATKLF
jgi:hypothetical protein